MQPFLYLNRVIVEGPSKLQRSESLKLTVDEAYERFADHVFAAAFNVCRNGTDADDVVQDTFIKYYSVRKEFSDEEHIKAWLLRVAINRAKDIRTSFWKRNKVAWEEYMEELVFEAPEDSRLFEAVMNLPQKYRTAIHLHYYEDYSIRKIAEILSSREGTVKSQLNRGRALLKEALMEEWNDEK